VYDGDQVLYELQMPGADSITPVQLERDTTTTFQPNLPFGRVTYTHGLDLDKPLDVIRIGYDSIWPGPEAVVPHTNWQGVADVGSWDDGRESRCTNYAAGQQATCIQISWPAPLHGLFFQDPYHDLFLPKAWFGSLIDDRRDASGQIYLRNRYYDPESGRFTQEDPLGLGGGMNAYGFASGDPVNYSDPFGLCPIPGACALIALMSTPSVISFVAKHPRAAEVTAETAQVTALVVIGAATDGLGDFAALGEAGEAIEGGATAAGVGSEARSAINGLRLAKRLASEAQMSESGSVIAGGESGTIFRNAAKYAEQYGGKASDWVKKTSSIFRAKDGTAFETHWVENTVTGFRTEFKTILK
jgi:RHS repeat-associated protein